MKRIHVCEDFSFSHVIHGQMRSLEWGINVTEYQALLEQLLAREITTLDNADIYGGFEAEAFLGAVFKQAPNLRDQFEIVTKCGIQFPNKYYPKTYINHYNYDYDYIIQQVDRSLINLNIEMIDVLLLHRPSPIMDAQVIAKACQDLQRAGKVRHFGVSNFEQEQFLLIEQALNQPLVTNQIELSVLNHEHIDNNNLDFLQRNNVAPMIWSPVAGGRIFNPKTEQEQRTAHCVQSIAHQYGVSMDVLLYAWLYKFPHLLMPIVGSGSLPRIEAAIQAQNIDLTTQQWFEIYQAKLGHSIK
ncbi:MAG: aldo/keto reductase [Culicoidibacterales bacterium]